MQVTRFGNATQTAANSVVKNKFNPLEILSNLGYGAGSLISGTPFYGTAKHPLLRDNKLLQWGYMGHKGTINSLALTALLPTLGTVGLLAGLGIVALKELYEYRANDSHRKLVGHVFQEAANSENMGDFLKKVWTGITQGPQKTLEESPEESTEEKAIKDAKEGESLNETA